MSRYESGIKHQLSEYMPPELAKMVVEELNLPPHLNLLLPDINAIILEQSSLEDAINLQLLILPYQRPDVRTWVRIFESGFPDDYERFQPQQETFLTAYDFITSTMKAARFYYNTLIKKDANTELISILLMLGLHNDIIFLTSPHGNNQLLFLRLTQHDLQDIMDVYWEHLIPESQAYLIQHGIAMSAETIYTRDFHESVLIHELQFARILMSVADADEVDGYIGESIERSQFSLVIALLKNPQVRGIVTISQYKLKLLEEAVRETAYPTARSSLRVIVGLFRGLTADPAILHQLDVLERKLISEPTRIIPPLF